MKLLFMDVDGTLTDGKIYIGENGELMKAFSVKDGYAIKNELPYHNIIPIILTARESNIVLKRADELGIKELHQSCIDKEKKMREICNIYGLNTTKEGRIRDTIYFGDDDPDMCAMRISELVGCPSDASRHVKALADYICKEKAGNGAAREFIEWIIDNEKHI